MKKILLFISALNIYALGIAQSIQASLGAGTQANSVKIYLKPSETQAPANISTLQFNIGIDTNIKPKPVMTVMSTTFPSVTWTVTEATEGGFNNYQLTTATSPLQPNTTANTEFEVMEVVFNNGSITPQDVSLVTLPDGGTGASTGNSLFLCTGSFTSNGSSLYYARPGSTVSNNFSYDENGILPGLLTSTATVSGITLPVVWLDFAVKSQNDKALVDWKVGNYELVDFYQVDRSTNGREFTTISTVKNNSGLQTEAYRYADEKISQLNAKTIYYRIKQKDFDGKYSVSEVRSLRLDTKHTVVVYPNPATNGFYVKISNVNQGDKMVTLKLRNNLSQVVETKRISGMQAANYYYSLNKTLKSGNYVLEIYNDEVLLDSKSILINK